MMTFRRSLLLASLCLIYSNLYSVVFANQYYMLDQKFINEPRKLKGEIISPFYYTIVKKDETGNLVFDDETEINLDKDSLCFLNRVNSNRIKYNHKFTLGKEYDEKQKSLKKLRSIAFFSGRVDTIIYMTSETSASFYIWGKSKAVYKYKNSNEFSLEKAFKKFCDKLNYNAVVVGTEGNDVYIRSNIQETKVDKTTQAVVYGEWAKQPFVKIVENDKASAVLSFKSVKNGVYTFTNLVGDVKVWDKVYIDTERRFQKGGSGAPAKSTPAKKQKKEAKEEAKAKE